MGAACTPISPRPAVGAKHASSMTNKHPTHHLGSGGPNLIITRHLDAAELSRLEKWRADRTFTGVAIYNELYAGFRDIYPTLLELSLWNGTHAEVLLADTKDKMAELRDPEILSVVSNTGLSTYVYWGRVRGRR